MKKLLLLINSSKNINKLINDIELIKGFGKGAKELLYLL
jgi:hypothetical protein